MSTIKTLSIKQPSGSGFDSRDIGAEAQYIDVSYDSNGNIIEDITAPGVVVDHTESTAKALKDINTDMSDKAPKSHASTTNVYGAASETEYGHVKIGTGLLNTSGTVSVHYGNTSETACEGNDSRLSDTRNTTNSLTFNNGGSGAASGTTFNGSVARTISYNTVGAAPKSHASTTTDYGVASSTNYGHVKTGTGINNSSGTISVSYGTAAGTACQGNDSRLSDTRNTPNSITFNNGGSGAASGTTFNGSVARTISYNTVGAAPTSHASTSTTYGGGTASYFGHVKLSDTYTSNVGAAANSIAASQTALYNVFNSFYHHFKWQRFTFIYSLNAQTDKWIDITIPSSINTKNWTPLGVTSYDLNWGSICITAQSWNSSTKKWSLKLYNTSSSNASNLSANCTILFYYTTFDGGVF